MVLFDSQSLNRLRYLSLVARQAGGGLLAKPCGQLPAGGTELTGHRDYAPGDDYRQVDWNLCARHDELLVKQFQGEADCPVYILLDCSRSMSLGRPRKFDVARQAAGALAYVALLDLERVSVLGFSDRIVADFGPVSHKARILGLVRFLEQLAPRGDATDLEAVAEGFVRRRQRHGLAVVVSDLYDSGGFDRAPSRSICVECRWKRGLEILRRRGYHPRVVQLCDPRDSEPGFLGDVELVDVETGASWQVTMTEQQVRWHQKLYAEFHRSVRSYCAGHDIACAQVPIDLPQERLLLTALGVKG